jgi:chromate transporter
MNGDHDIAIDLFLHFALLSMMAIGGGVISLAPDMLRYVVETHHWMSADSFVECFTLAQVAPGPNFLFATLVGMQVAGLTGAVAATVALVVPPAALTMASLHFGSKIKWGKAGHALRTAILPLSIGMIASTAWSLGTMTVHSAAQAGLFLATLCITLATRLNPLWLIAMGACAGMAGWV